MANTVKTIRESFEGVVQSALGTEWQQLDYKWDLANNNFSNSEKRYGVIVQDGANSPTLLNHYSIARDFTLRMVTTYENYQDETGQQTAVDILEDALDTVIINALANRFGSNLITSVDIEGISGPDFSIDSAVVLEATFSVTYRKMINNC